MILTMEKAISAFKATVEDYGGPERLLQLWQGLGITLDSTIEDMCENTLSSYSKEQVSAVLHSPEFRQAAIGILGLM